MPKIVQKRKEKELEIIEEDHIPNQDQNQFLDRDQDQDDQEGQEVQEVPEDLEKEKEINITKGNKN